jgi:hypothetical protein
MLLSEPGTALDIGEEKADGAGWKLDRISHLQC